MPAAMKTTTATSERSDSRPRPHTPWPLVAGAAIFGIGWGIGGYCPGPAVTALANLSAGTLVFVGAMVAGGILARIPPSIRRGA